MLKKIKDYLNSLHSNNTLSDTESEMCDNGISEEECFSALSHNMKTNKASCHDGIPAEFYKKNRTEIKKTLMDSYKWI